MTLTLGGYSKDSHLKAPRNSKPPRILVLHYADVPQRDIEAAQGFKFTHDDSNKICDEL